MKIQYSIIFFSLFIQTSFATTNYQFFLSPYFYQNLDSFQINGLIAVRYNTGNLFDEAAKLYSNESGHVLKKCNAGEKSNLIYYLYPRSFYNPLMTTFYTDLEVRVFEAPGKLKKNLLVKHQTLKPLFENPDSDIIEHYKNLLNKLIMATKISDNDFKLDGSFCNILD